MDPAFTLGLLERRRRETLAALTAAGLLEKNRALPLPDLPLSIALITSHGSAAYHDFLSGLVDSGYGFRVLFVHAAMQGREDSTAARRIPVLAWSRAPGPGRGRGSPRRGAGLRVGQPAAGHRPLLLLVPAAPRTLRLARQGDIRCVISPGKYS